MISKQLSVIRSHTAQYLLCQTLKCLSSLLLPRCQSAEWYDRLLINVFKTASLVVWVEQKNRVFRSSRETPRSPNGLMCCFLVVCPVVFDLKQSLFSVQSASRPCVRTTSCLSSSISSSRQKSQTGETHVSLGTFC